MAKGVIYNGLSGIWGTLGCIPNPGESLSIRVEDSFNPETLEPYPSLVNLLGFSKEKKDLGVISDSKRVWECIVMLPMIRKNSGWTPDAPYNTATQSEVEEAAQATNCLECSDPCVSTETKPNNPYEEDVTDDFIGFYESEIEDAYLFKIKEETINQILSVPDYKKLSIFEIREILIYKKGRNRTNPIVNLMLNMLAFNFPPHLNWLLNKNIPPLVIYSAYFTHDFSKQDLANIWQGNLPNIGKEPEVDDEVVGHVLGKDTFFDGYDIINKDYDIKMRVFKIKYRAHNNYEKDIKGIGKYDKPYKKEDENDLNSDPGWYESNWPYDFFSIVELVNIITVKNETNEE